MLPSPAKVRAGAGNGVGSRGRRRGSSAFRWSTDTYQHDIGNLSKDLVFLNFSYVLSNLKAPRGNIPARGPCTILGLFALVCVLLETCPFQVGVQVFYFLLSCEGDAARALGSGAKKVAPSQCVVVDKAC